MAYRLRKIRSRVKFRFSKKALSGLFVLKPKLLGQPGLDSRGAVLSFPFLQRLVVAAFSFDDFVGVRFI
jgi:hypothetical protein